jgi:hypothetical protein
MPGLQYPNPNIPLIGKGSVFVDIWDPVTGLKTGYRHLGNVPTFEIEDKVDKAILYSSMNKTVAKIATAAKKRDLTVSLKGNDFSMDHMEIVTMCSGKSSLAVTAGAVTGTPLISAAQTAVCKGRFFRTQDMNLDSTIPIVVKQGATTFTNVTDYVVLDWEMGIVFIPTTSSIASGAAITADYTKLAKTYTQIAAATRPFLPCSILFDPDPVDGQKMGCEVWKANLSANGKLGLISDDYNNWELEADILDDSANHPTAPYYMLTGF